MIKNSICTLPCVLMFLFSANQCARKTTNEGHISYYLPLSNELKVWRPVGQPQKFEGEDLFLYIDGGAEIYYEYGFTQVITQEYRNEKDKIVNLELYEMEDPAGAYGMYTFKTGDIGQKIEIGNDAFLEEYYLNFWKGNFLVTLTGFDSEKETADGLLAIAKATDTRINARGKKPLLPDLLPNNDLRTTSIKYVKGNLGLFNHYQFDSENIFGLREGVIGKYGSFEAFIFRYDDEQKSMKWYENARNHLKNNPRFHSFSDLDSVFSMKDGEQKPVHVELCRNYIIIILGGGQAGAELFLAEMRDRIGKGWIIEEE